jgi:hypothetical protein
MSEQPYVNGQIVNGHMFNAATNQWVPMGVATTPGGQPPKKSNKMKWILGGVAAFLLIGIGSAMAGGGSKPAATSTPSASPTVSASASATASETPSATATPTVTEDAVVETPTPTPTPTPKPTPTVKPETVSQSNARDKAESYLAMTAFSRTGLIKQLQFEGFSKADSTYGVDATHTNWNEQAALKAQSYLDMTSFSRSSLISQLKFEGFTTAQAKYGVKSVGL